MDKENSAPISFLCIGLSPVLVSIILNKAEKHKLSLDFTNNASAARQKIESNEIYDLYLIDWTLKDTLPTNLIKEIHQKKEKKTKIAIIYETDEQEVQKLYDDGSIDYLIHKSTFDFQFEEILKIVSLKISNQPSSNLQEIKRQYDEGINNKINNLKQLIEKSQKDPQFIKRLKEEVHKTGGSAGSFGYPGVSELCKAMELEINEKLNDETFKDSQWLSSLDDFLKKVRQNFQTSYFADMQSTPSPHSLYKPLIYVVDDDVNFLELLERIKGDFSVELCVDFDPIKALEKLTSPQFNPNFIIVAESFRSSSIKGFDIIKAQQEKKLASSALFGLIIEEENIDTRIRALQEGVNYLFRKPVSAYIMLKTMLKALESRSLKSLKVLVVDDDVDFCRFVKAVLEEIGVSTFAIHDSQNLFKSLEEYRPQILLLDLLLPKYDGLNLLKTIRQDVTYKNLIIIIVTINEKFDTTLSAYAANVDDILFKPINKDILQKRILNISSRWISANDTNNFTGLCPYNSLIGKLSDAIKKSEYLLSFLVLFEIRDYESWVSQNGYGASKDLMISISNELQMEADFSMRCFFYQASKFAVVFESPDFEIVEKRMFNLLTNIVVREKRWDLAFNCSIVPISKNFITSANILTAAEDALREVSKRPSSKVNIIYVGPKEGDSLSKEIVIIDSDTGLLKILKQAFESHGMVVHTFSEGGEALKKLLSYSEDHLPSLVIMERRLPDMDGMELYLTLKNRFRKTIPFLLLTIFSSDKDISEGLQQGISEYIIKPFNITILIQKALKLIKSH